MWPSAGGGNCITRATLSEGKFTTMMDSVVNPSPADVEILQSAFLSLNPRVASVAKNIRWNQRLTILRIISSIMVVVFHQFPT